MPINKEALYGNHQKFADRKRDLFFRTAAKSLDMPEDDMQIIQNKNGMGWKELAIVGLLSLAGGMGCLGLGAAALLAVFNNQPSPPPTPAPTPPPAAEVRPVEIDDSEYEVLFFDAEGNPIRVPHISTKK